MSRFAPIVVDDRLRRVRERLDAVSADAIVIGSLTNIRYLTGFTGSAGLAIVTPRGGMLCVDGRYGQQASEQLTRARCDVEIRVVGTSSEMNETVARAMSSHSRVVYDATEFTLAQFEALGGATSYMHRMDGFVGAVRECKDAAELERIAFAASCADAALGQLEQLVGQARVTERDLRDELEYLMRKAGADGPSYDTIVASGENAALPHHRPTSRTIVEGDSLVIDIGALVEGYHSDMTRTFVVGEPTQQQSERYQLVLAAQRAGLAAVHAGASAASIDHAARSVIEAAGFGDWFSHGTGHGVGLLIQIGRAHV